MKSLLDLFTAGRLHINQYDKKKLEQLEDSHIAKIARATDNIVYINVNLRLLWDCTKK